MMRKYTKEIALVHGIKDMNNKLIKRTQLRSLNGYDEEFMNMMESADLPFPIKTSYLLSRIVSFGDEECDENVKLPMVKKMTIGDRVLLILHLRQLIFGDTFHIDLQCNSCSEFISIDLSINSILNNFLSKQNDKYALDEETGFYEIEISELLVKLRLLNGLDHENICLNDLNEKEIIQSCLVNMDSIGYEKLQDEEFKERVNSDLSELDPLSDVVLTMTCPFCNASFKIPFVVEDFFFKEVRSQKNNLEYEVHWLALNYHWSESEILSLPISKRRRYVKLIDKSLMGK